MKLCARLRLSCATQILLIIVGTAAGLYFSSFVPTFSGIVVAVLLWRRVKAWHCAGCGKPVAWDTIPVGAGNVWGWTIFFSGTCRSCRLRLDENGTRRKAGQPSPAYRPWERSFGPIYLWLFGVVAAAIALLDFWGRLPMGAPGAVSGARLGF